MSTKEIHRRIREYVTVTLGLPGIAAECDPVEFLIASHFALVDEVKDLGGIIAGLQDVIDGKVKNFEEVEQQCEKMR